MVKPICFYLPQFHPVPENDEWWGKGFTEWRNVDKAVPNFAGHYQPHQPADLGYYDLRDINVQRNQASLAKAHGIYGFCMYYYWFNGRRILELPLNNYIANKDIDFPFCVCWANENWTKNWDGGENEVLLAQRHMIEDDENFIRSLLPMFRDPRYIRVDNKPMLLIYRVAHLPRIAKTAALWRRIASQEGFDGLHLCAVQYGMDDPRPFGFDAGVEFPPHGYVSSATVSKYPPPLTNPQFAGEIVNYQRVIAAALGRDTPDYIWYRGVMPSWDNTARRQHTPCIFAGSSPLDYQYWLRRIVAQTQEMHAPESQFLFINAWNEWAEGAHLEPDRKYGHANLDATKAAVETRAAVGDLIAQGACAERTNVSDVQEGAFFARKDESRRKRKIIQERKHPSLLDTAKRGLRRFPRVKRGLKKLLRRG